MTRVVLGVIAAAAAMYLAVLAFFFFAQGSLLFPAPSGARAPRGHLLTGDGFVALWAAPPSAQAPVVVHFHGNGEDLADAGPMMELLQGLGAGVLAVEYPGYGVAPGKRGEQTCYAAAEAALRHLRDVEKVAPERTVLQGQSLGSGVATELAARGWGSRLVLISPFTSVAELAHGYYPLLPVGLLVRHRFESAAKAPRVQRPVLIVHGTADEVVPFRMGEALSRLFPQASLVPVPGGHHNDLFSSYRSSVRGALEPFLSGAR